MINLHVVYDVAGWSYHHIARALQEHCPDDFAITMGSYTDFMAAPASPSADLVLCLPYHQLADVRQKASAKARIVASFNTGKCTRGELRELLRHCDWLVVNNDAAWEQAGRLERTTPIANGVDLDLFRPLDRVPERHRVLWVGSRLYAELKGYPILQQLEQEIPARLRVATDFRLVDSFGKTGRRMSLEEMAQWYQTGTIYVCVSEYEGTPNPVIESMASGLVIVSTPVGNVPELIRNGFNGIMVQRSSEAILSGIEMALCGYRRLREKSLETIVSRSWKHQCQIYFALLRNVVSQRN